MVSPGEGFGGDLPCHINVKICRKSRAGAASAKESADNNKISALVQLVVGRLRQRTRETLYCSFICLRKDPEIVDN